MNRLKKFAGILLPVLMGLHAEAVTIQYDDQIPQVSFAAAKVSDALKDAGIEDVVVRFQIKPDSGQPESFAIKRPDSSRIVITGTDAAGAMYGGLEVAEELRIGGILLQSIASGFGADVVLLVQWNSP